MGSRCLALACGVLPLVLGAAGDAAQEAYRALKARDYDRAVAAFTRAIAAAPGRAALHKDLAYAYLKIGETEAAREQFAEAMRLDAADSHSALEYAFLCHETQQQAEARRVFDRIRRSGDAAARETAERAFRNIDGALAEGIARWSAVAAGSPGDFSAQRELARLAEQRDELELAAESYRNAWRLRPAERSLLLDLARVWKAQGRLEQAGAALLAASRGSPPRVAEEARELLPPRYPYVAEFRAALELDPANLELRRELAYLLLEMRREEDAEREFARITERFPEEALSAAQLGLLRLKRNDRAGAMPLLERALKSDDDELIARVRAALRLPPDLRRRPRPGAPAAARQNGAKEMADRSYRLGYLQDALRYLEAAHEADPLDFSVLLKLGWTYNLLRQDDRAVRWFELARRSPDPRIAEEAGKAYRNLRPALRRVRTTAWAFPFFSSRWRDVFSYAQVKTDFRVGRLPFRPYLSTRFIGDSRRTTGEALPQYLSESSVLFAAGAASRNWGGAVLWGEAGTAVSYVGREVQARMVPDYRGGVSFARGAGRLLGGEAHGWFAETGDDGVFVSRFQNDFLVYSQNRFGYTLPAGSGFRAQLYLNTNVTLDVQRQYWANFAEFGPGVRFRWEGLPESLVFSVNVLRGVYTRNQGNPRRPNFFDLRAGFWYAVSH